MARLLRMHVARRGMNRRRLGRLMRQLLRAPGALYDWRLGCLLGHRFLRLTHIGRRSGHTYHTVLEVVGQNRANNEFIVVAGLGRSSQWYRNLQVHEGIEVAIARERFAPVHRELPISEAEVVLSAYEQRDRFLAPLVHRALSWLVSWRYDGTQAARQRLVGELPLIGLRPAWLESAGEPIYSAVDRDLG